MFFNEQTILCIAACLAGFSGCGRLGYGSVAGKAWASTPLRQHP